MYTAWTQHLQSDEDKEKFTKTVLRAEPVLSHLKHLIEVDLKDTQQAERSIKAYENNNWAYRQAHVNGYIAAMTKLLTLVDLDQQKRKPDDQSVKRKLS